MFYLNHILSLTVASGLLLSGCSPEQAKTNISIKRDDYGTPHIYAQDNYGLFYGYGFSLAQDRLYQMEILRHSTQGTVSEILGKDYVSFDISQRTLFWPEDIKKQLRTLDDDNKEIFAGFAAGLNNYIEHVQKNKPARLPLEFIENGFEPQHWTEYDVIMLFVGTMLMRYGDYNTELDNQAFLTDLQEKHGKDMAKKIFNAVIPTDNTFAPTTIPLADWPTQQGSSPIKPQYVSPKIPKLFFRPSKPGHGFSNALVLGPTKVKNAKAVLINGPQFGWYVPAYTYSVGFHTPDWEAVGSAPLGYPLPMFGYNDTITWGSTWGASDNVDIFRETLNPDTPNAYKYNNNWETFQTRSEIIKVKGNISVPFTARRSVHGPIIHTDEKNGYAYAKMRGWAGKELETLIGWMEATKAKNHHEWFKAVGKSALNVNWYYADKVGNIAYTSAGSYPIRSAGHDNRLPVSGEGKMDWIGLNPPSWNPHVLNPSSGYIANWNNKPRSGFTNPDEWWYSWSEADRIKVINDAVNKQGKMSPEQAWQLMMNVAYVDPNASYFLPLMQAALSESKNPRHQEIADILATWDGRFQYTTKKGTYTTTQNTYAHPANAIFRYWLGQMLFDVLSDDLPGSIGNIISTTTGYGTPEKPTAAGLNISTGSKLLYEILQGRSEYDFLNGDLANKLWRRSLDKTLVSLEQQYGPDISNWQLAVPATRFNDTNFLNIPQTLARQELNDMPAMNRGTQNNMTIFNDSNTPIGYEVAAPGQSGFLSSKGDVNPHYLDQYEIFRAHGKKSTWLNSDDINRHTESEIILYYTKP